MASPLDEVLQAKGQSETSVPTSPLDQVLQAKGQTPQQVSTSPLDQVLQAKGQVPQQTSRDDLGPVTNAAVQKTLLNTQLQRGAYEAARESQARGLKVEAYENTGLAKKIAQEDNPFNTAVKFAVKSGASQAQIDEINKARAATLEEANRRTQRGPSAINDTIDTENAKLDAPWAKLWNKTTSLTKTPREKLADVLDYIPSGARQVAMLATGGHPTIKNDTHGTSSEEYSKYLKDNSLTIPEAWNNLKKGKLPSSANVLSGIFDVPAAAAGTLREPGLQNETPEFYKDEKGNMQRMPTNVREEILQQKRDKYFDAAKATSASVLTDPTLVLGGGEGGAKVVLGQGERLAAKAGLEGVKAEEFAKNFVKVASEVDPGKIGAGPAMRKFSAEAGIPEHVIDNVLGKQGELIGRQGITVAGQNVSNVIPRMPERPIARATNAAQNLFGKGLERVGLKQEGKLFQLPTQQRTALTSKMWQEGAKQDAAVVDKINSRNETIRMLKDALDRGETFGQGAELSTDTVKKMLEDPEALKAELKNSDLLKAKGKKQAAENMMRYTEHPDVQSLGQKSAANIKDIVEERMLKRQAPPGALQKKINDTTDWIRNTSLFGRPGYHAQNMPQDFFLNMQHGNVDVKGMDALQKIENPTVKGEELVVNTPHTQLTKDQILKEAEDLQFLKEGGGRLSREITPSSKDIGRELYNALGKKKPLNLTRSEDVANAISLGASKPGKELASNWDKQQKLSSFATLRGEGYAPEAAVQKMHEGIPNFSDPGNSPKLLHELKKIDPMVGWAARAVTMAPAGALKSPLLSKLPMNIAKGTNFALKESGDKSAYDPIPESERTKGITINLGQEGTAKVNSMLRAAGLPEMPPGMGTSTTVRTPLDDVLGTFWAENPTYDNASPITKTIRDIWSGKDRFGNPIDPSPEGQAIYAARQLGQTASGSNLNMLIDVAAKLAGTKNYLTGYDPGDKEHPLAPYPKQGLVNEVGKWATGAPTFQTKPGTNLQDIDRSKKLKELNFLLDQADKKTKAYKSGKIKANLLEQESQ